MFKRSRSFGLFSILSLSVITVLSLMLLNTVRFDGSIRAIFDREHGLYDQSFASRSQTYWLGALKLIPELNESGSGEVRQQILEKVDFAYAYLNIGRYLERYDCTHESLEAMLRLRSDIEMGLMQTSDYSLWHTVFSCYSEVQLNQETLKSNMITRALDASHKNQFWMNIGILATYALAVVLWLMVEYHNRKSNREVKEKQAWQTRALKDHLTSTYNRLALQERLEELVERWPDGSSAALIFYDLDHFKSYNDTYGHVAGDDALKKVTSTVSRLVGRSEDHFRFGGEEFFITLENKSKEDVVELGHQIVRTVHGLQMPNPSSDSGYLTVSLGIYCLEKRSYTSDELIQKVDELLYSAKKSGRNCAVDCHR